MQAFAFRHLSTRCRLGPKTQSTPSGPIHCRPPATYRDRESLPPIGYDGPQVERASEYQSLFTKNASLLPEAA